MTPEQLETLNKDIESGLVMTVTVEHYQQMENKIKQLADALAFANGLLGKEQ